MKAWIVFSLALACSLTTSCKHGDSANRPHDAEPMAQSSRPRVWMVGGAPIPVMGSTYATQGELMGPDASFAGSGPLEGAVGLASQEPLPTGANAPTLDGGVLPDVPPATEPQSPYDPALKNPPEGSPAPSAEEPPKADDTPPAKEN